MNWPHLFCTVLVSVLLMAVFISVFFFVYGNHIEKNIVVREIGNITSQFTTDLKLMLPQDAVDELLQTIDRTKIPDFSKENATVKKNNSKLFEKTMAFLGGFAAVFIILIVVMVVKFKLHFGKIMVYNTITLVFVGLTYALFATFFIGNYHLIDFNFVKAVLLKNLKPFLKSQS